MTGANLGPYGLGATRSLASEARSERDYPTKRGLITDDLVRYQWLDDLTLSPEGSQVAYTVKRVNDAGTGYVTHLYVRSVAATEAVRITDGDGMATSPTWSPDGTGLAYGWREGGSHAIRVWGGRHEGTYAYEGSPLTELAWHPSGDSIAATQWVPVRYEKAARPGATVRTVNRLRYKQDGVGWVHDRFKQIVRYHFGSRTLQQVTSQSCDHGEPQWSPDGATLAFVAMGREQDEPLGQGQVFLWDATGDHGPRPLLPAWEGAARSPVWSADGQWIAFAGHNHPAPTNRRIFMVPHLADVHAGTARRIVADFDEEVGNYAASDSRTALSNITMKWAPGDPWIYFLASIRGATHLFRVTVDGDLECIVDGETVAFQYSPSATGKVAYGRATPTNPGDLYIWAGSEQRLTDLNAWLRDHEVISPMEYTYPGLDETPVQAWRMLPRRAAEGQPHPTILYVHCSMFSWDFSHEFQCLASAGYVVAYFNQRGTTAGFGQAWTRASEGDQGGRDYEEIMLGVDHLCQLPEVDASNLGITGGSCGGFMTNWVIGHSDRFKAAVTQRSISNKVSFFGCSDIGPEGTEAESGANPWADLEAVWRQSPLAYAPNIQTPLLIIHADEDHRCALEQAEQLFAALRWHRRDVELVVFEGESHGLSRGGRPPNRMERIDRIRGWFDRHLAKASDALPRGVNP